MRRLSVRTRGAKLYAAMMMAGLALGACDKTKVVTSTGGKGGGVGGGSVGGATGAGGGMGGAGGSTLTAQEKRGKYLVDNVAACGDCHTPRDQNGPIAGMYLAGNPMFVVLPNGAALGTRNLTKDAPGHKNRTDGDIKNMFQNGLRPVATGMEPLNP